MVALATSGGYADLGAIIARASEAWRPPTRLRLSEWADRNFVLSPESAAVPGPWHTLPYQREILDAISDPLVEQVSVMKSARVGYTLMMSAAVGYFIAHEPSPLLIVQPTVDDAKAYSKETIAPMLRDVPALASIMFKDVEERGPKDPTATLRLKMFPGGVLSLIGANSGAGFRRVSRRVVMFDEVDAYPPSAGAEGDPINLGIKRTEAFHNRKIIAGSTPLIAGASRIEEMFEAGDRRHYHVPCPQCGHMDILVFYEGERGHYMRWPEGQPEQAYFVCKVCGDAIEHHQKRWMIERGEWRADKPGGKHRSFHVWSAYSYSPNASWGQIAIDFLAAKRGGVEKLKTFVNTTLGETWQERGEAPDWERLFLQRESYPIGTVPAGVRFLTASVDVHKDRFQFEVVGWSASKENWSIDAGVLMGDTSQVATWSQLDDLLMKTFAGEGGRMFSIAMLAIDSGYATQEVYNWARRYPLNRVMVVKGVGHARTLVGLPTGLDVTAHGKRIGHGNKVWPIGVGIAKTELYGWLRLARPAAGKTVPGYCHFPQYDEEFFRQLTAEHLVRVVKRSGFATLEWALLPNRENHALDCRIYARAAASRLGLDRMVMPPAPRPAQSAAAAPPTAASSSGPGPAPAPPRPPAAAPARPREGWLAGRPSWLGRPGWLGRRR